ncbi:MAG: DJ-1/PfpI family protein [Patescibacteria group bacterium]|nr:DJ-1/PfpI family protein [Patescibacteria group bacterium]
MNLNNEKLSNKKVLMFLAKKNFRDEEYLEPRKILEEQGAEIKIASLESGEAVGFQGARVNIDLQIRDINVADFDALVFVGGVGIIDFLDDPRLTGLARDFYYADEKIVAAICVAPAILANAGLLKEKKAVSYDSVTNILKDRGAILNSLDVQTDGKIITASGPLSARDFGRAIASALASLGK